MFVFVVKFYFATIISLPSTLLWEKGRIRIRTCNWRIRKVQIQADSMDPKHWLQIKLGGGGGGGGLDFSFYVLYDI